MLINTTSEVISVARQLENDSSAFYAAESARYPNLSEVLSAFSRENLKNIKQIEQTYYGVITDAIEGCFAFNLETGSYILDTSLKNNTDLPLFVAQAIQIEDQIRRFYLEAGGQAKSLMADISRSFMLSAKKRKERLAQLAGLPST